MNTISEGRDKRLPPDKDGVIERRPTTALEDLKIEIVTASSFKASGQAAESRALSSVESRTDLRLAAINELSRGDPKRPVALEIEKNIAQNWADLDSSDYARLRSPQRKEVALESIAANMRVSPEYADEIKRRSPVLAEAATHLNAERQKLEAQAAREAAEQRIKDESHARAAARSMVIDAAAMATLAALVREQSAAVSAALSRKLDPAVRPELTIPHREFDAIGSATEIAARKLIEKTNDGMLAIPRNGLDQNAARDAVRGDIAAIKEIAHKTERYFAAVAIGDNANNQSNYRAELKRQDPALAKEADSAFVENGRRMAVKEDMKAQDMEAIAIAKRPVRQPICESDVSEAMRKRFIVSTEKTGVFSKGHTEFSFRNGDNQGAVAFVDKGKNLTTERQDKETIRSMIEVSVTKGWKEITVSGTDEFRRAAWLEGRLNNLEVRGYEPRETDKKLLADLAKDRATTNKIELAEREPRREHPVVSHGKQTRGLHIDGDALNPAEKDVLKKSAAAVRDRDGPVVEAAFAKELEARLRGERVYIGQLVDHGSAKYKFDDKNDPSYFVTLKTAQGDKTVWGKHLGSAMEKGDLKAGDQIVLRNTGQKNVEVSERLFDDAGKFTGTRPKATHLNEWTADPLSRFSEKARDQMEVRSHNSSPQLPTPIQQATRDADRPPPANSLLDKPPLGRTR